MLEIFIYKEIIIKYVNLLFLNLSSICIEYALLGIIIRIIIILYMQHEQWIDGNIEMGNTQDGCGGSLCKKVRFCSKMSNQCRRYISQCIKINPEFMARPIFSIELF